MLYKSYHVAHSLSEAIALLASDGDGSVRPIAGGTDLMLQLRERPCSAERLVDVGSVPELKRLELQGDVVKIGAAVTYRELIESDLIAQQAYLLHEASRQVGATQIQNMGTIGGNLGNASPAGDLLPCLYALEAIITVASPGGERSLPVADFLRGYRQTDLRPGELIKDITLRALTPDTGSAFVKLGLRQGQAISVVMVAAVLGVRAGRIRRTAIALGAVAPTIVRSIAAETVLLGQRPTADVFDGAAAAARRDIRPIDDVRGTAAYRRHVTRPLVREALTKAWERAAASQTGASE
ncbi:MAG: xanthine dehydrogenase family protein subunit M [Anaerolineales bacterium]|nr:xanthine dehydrogenase family protein subunit M [Anaerolineales bacterium]